MTSGTSLGMCEGERYHDICADPLTCGACSLWRQPEESVADWKARLYRIANTDPLTCRNGHPWTNLTSRYTPEGIRYCRLCKRGNGQRWLARQRQEAVS